MQTVFFVKQVFMNAISQLIFKLFKIGGWAPLLILVIHVVLSRVLSIYSVWPNADIPMHFSGGVGIAFFISRCFQELPRETYARSRLILLELILIGSLGIFAAVCWEFAEFACDHFLGTNLQISLANTMQDLAMGFLGATTFIALRAHSLRASPVDLHQFLDEWMGKDLSNPT